MKNTILPSRSVGKQTSPFGSPEVRAQRDQMKDDAYQLVNGAGAATDSAFTTAQGGALPAKGKSFGK